MNMSLDSVLAFREKMGLPVNSEPQLLSPDQSSFYARFILEELSEFLKAHEHQNLVDAADAIGDMIYVILGCSLHMGLPLEAIFESIHRANMTKIPGKTKRDGLGQDAKKPDNWRGPEADIRNLLGGAHGS